MTTVCVVLVAAFALAPHSCEGGLEIYSWGGVALLIVLIVVAVIVPLGNSLRASIGWACAVVMLATATWIAGLFAANFRIICRLF